MRPIILGILFAAALAIAGIVAWRGAAILLLIFAAIIVSRVLAATGGLVKRFTPLSHKAALWIAIVLIVAMAVGFLSLVGSQIYSQIMTLIERLPQDIEALGDTIGIEDPFEQLMGRLQQNGTVWNVVGYTVNAVTIMTSLIVVAVAGIFLALGSDTYRSGILILVPKSLRASIGHAIDTAGRALELWLMGKLLMMVIIFAATTLGLYVIGVPSALTLGILAGILEFVPFIGPIVAAIPALAIAISEGGPLVYWVLGLYVVVQQIENNLLVPLIQKSAVQLPPVLSLFAILMLGALFGILGFLLAMPLTVVLVVFVKQLYVRDILEEDIEIQGERSGTSP